MNPDPLGQKVRRGLADRPQPCDLIPDALCRLLLGIALGQLALGCPGRCLCLKSGPVSWAHDMTPCLPSTLLACAKVLDVSSRASIQIDDVRTGQGATLVPFDLHPMPPAIHDRVIAFDQKAH